MCSKYVELNSELSLSSVAGKSSYAESICSRYVVISSTFRLTYAGLFQHTIGLF